MPDDGLKTLFHPFNAGNLPAPSDDARVVFFGAGPGFRLPDGWQAPIDGVQPFRPLFLELRKQSMAVAPRVEEDDYGTALVLVGRHRDRNEAWLAQALAHTVCGGLIVVAGGKEDGVASLRKRVGQLIEIEGSEPKYHGIVFWFRRPREADRAINALGQARLVIDGRFETAPGIFSNDRVDPGSAFLARHLPAGIGGMVADFAAGWGYLSAELLSRGHSLTRLDLYEADYEALQAARRNLAAYPAPPTQDFFWRDLVGEAVERRYDTIIMNPPFHAGRAAEPRLGQEMISAAARALKPRGRLFMVANRPLPYESVLSEAFSANGELARSDRFKVLWGQR